MAIRNVYIDCGAWSGGSVLEFKKHYPNYEVYAFECHPDLQEKLRKLSHKHNFTLIDKAVWVEDGETKLYLGVNGLTQSSTLFSNKKKYITTKNPAIVKTINFSKWIKDNFSPDDNIICKMNIEGAEYDVLGRMLIESTLKYIKKLYVAWHYNKLKGFNKEIHDSLIPALVAQTKVSNWDYDERDGKNPF